MRKIFKFFMIVLCLCPVILLSACTSPAKFLITAGKSDNELGSIQGNLNNEMEEGTKITLLAKEHYPESNPFICWVKDYNKVASTKKSLTLSYNKNTAGHYTAVFAESLSSMRFSSLSNIKFESENYVNGEFEIYSALTSTGSDNFTLFSSGKTEINEEFKTDNKNIIYLGEANSNSNYNEYKFKVKVKMTNSQNIQNEYEFEINTLLNYKSFDSDGNCILKQSVNLLNTTLTLTFSKLSTLTFVDENN